MSTTRVSTRAKNPTAGSRRGEAEPSESTLLIKARDLVAGRQWGAALKVLDKLRALDGDTPETLGLVAVASSHARRRRVRDEALSKLTAAAPDARAWEAIASAHLATADFADADRAARLALAQDDTSSSAWATLAASFAGLGWFSEADDCLRSCDRHGGLDAFGRWQLGRAVNRWALSRNHAPLVALVATILLGNIWLGLALAFTAPLAAREFRVGLLKGELKELAETQWFEERRLRVAYGSAVLFFLAAWVAIITFT